MGPATHGLNHLSFPLIINVSQMRPAMKLNRVRNSIQGHSLLRMYLSGMALACAIAAGCSAEPVGPGPRPPGVETAGSGAPTDCTCQGKACGDDGCGGSC